MSVRKKSANEYNAMLNRGTVGRAEIEEGGKNAGKGSSEDREGDIEVIVRACGSIDADTFFLELDARDHRLESELGSAQRALALG